MSLILETLKQQPLYNPSGYNPNPVPAASTDVGRIGNMTEEQIEQQQSSVVLNNTKRQNQENAKNGMVGGVLPVTGVGTDEPIRFGNQVNIGDVANQVIREKVADSKRSPSPQYDPYEDIKQLTETLKQQQDEERAKFERKRMADRISRMGFALGNLIGANGGNSDASAITLDDGSRQVGEYRKDMEDINKENQAAYQRALDLIYRKEDRDYKNASLDVTRAKNEADLAEKIRHNQEWEDLNRSKFEETQNQNQVKNDQNQQKINQNQQKINQGQQKINQSGNGKTNQKGTQTVTERTDKDGNKITTVTTRMPYNGKNGASRSLLPNQGGNYGGTPKFLNFN